MNFPDLLAQKVKPELNHIYTEHPKHTVTGLDCGWYCREHAVHLYVLALLLKKSAAICLGDFILRRPDGDCYYSVGDASDHAWCCIDECSPADVSMTVKYIYPDIPNVIFVYMDRPDLANGFSIEHHVKITDNSFMNYTTADKLLIAYNEISRMQPLPLPLLSEPFGFLHRPPLGTPTFLELFGSSVLYSITLHCFRLITDNIKPLYSYRDSSSTVRQIMKNNPNAKEIIQHMLQ